MPPTTAPEPAPQPPASLAVLLLGSLLQTGGIVWFLCRTPWHGSLTGTRLALTAGSSLAITLAAHLVAVWSNRRLLRCQVDIPVRRLALAIWPCTVWLPLLVLLIRRDSLWTAALLPLIAAFAVAAVRRWSAGTADPLAEPALTSLSTLFHPRTSPALPRTLIPTILTALAIEAAAATLAFRHHVIAGLLLALAALFPLWANSLHAPASSRSTTLRAAVRNTVVVFLLLILALLPYLRPGSVPSGQASADPAKPTHPLRADLATHATAGSYSGVVLILPPKLHPDLVLPQPDTAAPLGSLRRRSIRIPFDGEYWYFKQPDLRPQPDAPVVRGDPIARSVLSTNARPLLMVAHQSLATPIHLDCCRAIRLALRNGDDRPGRITVELLLRNTASPGPEPQSLGVEVIPSSNTPHLVAGTPPDELLTFPVPPRSAASINEFAIVIQPEGDNARIAAHVAIQYLELVP